MARHDKLYNNYLLCPHCKHEQKDAIRRFEKSNNLYSINYNCEGCDTKIRIIENCNGLYRTGKTRKKPKKKKMQYPYRVVQFLKWLGDQDIPHIRIPETMNFLILVSKGDYHYLSIEFRYMTDAYFKTNMKHFKVKRHLVESTLQAKSKVNKYMKLANVNSAVR